MAEGIRWTPTKESGGANEKRKRKVICNVKMEGTQCPPQKREVYVNDKYQLSDTNIKIAKRKSKCADSGK